MDEVWKDKRIATLEAMYKELEGKLTLAIVDCQSEFYEKVTIKKKLSVAIEVLEMVEDHRKMPHQHYDPVTKLYCLTERAKEALEEIKG